MTRKTFVANEILTAGDVNTYFMDQAVQTYGGTAARSSAIATAIAGQITYLQDTTYLDVAIGTATYRGLNYRTVTPSTAATYTISAADNNTLIYSTGTPTVTVPDVLQIGQGFEIIRGGGAVGLVAGTGVTTWAGIGTASVSKTFSINEQYNGAQVFKVAANSYFVIGKII